MKTLLTILILALSTTVFGQRSENETAIVLIDQLTNITEGYIAHEYYDDNGKKVAIINLPSYYSFDLARVSTRIVVDGLEGAIFVNPWSVHNTRPQLRWAVIMYQGNRVLIAYCTRDNVFFVTPGKND